MLTTTSTSSGTLHSKTFISSKSFIAVPSLLKMNASDKQEETCLAKVTCCLQQSMTSNTLNKHFVIHFTNLGVGFFGLAILAHVTNNVHKVVEGGQSPAIHFHPLVADNCSP